MSLLVLLACLCGAAAHGATASLSSKSCISPSEWDTCDWVESNSYTDDEPVKSRLFPETFEYVHKGLDGTEATTTHVLFGDLIAAVEETVDQDPDDDESARIKGFKPGTNAQRHRLHRIQHSRQASSRLADLTSMVRDSFRRVNVVSETDSDKASPAAAQPAARRQLTWRASAPEYGTFES